MTGSLGQQIYELSVKMRLVKPMKRDEQKLAEREILLIYFLLFNGRVSRIAPIRRTLDVSFSTLSSYLDRLEGHGYVRRVKDPADARRSTVELSIEGERYARHLLHCRGVFYENAIAELGATPDQQRLLIDWVSAWLQRAEAELIAGGWSAKKTRSPRCEFWTGVEGLGMPAIGGTM